MLRGLGYAFDTVCFIIRRCSCAQVDIVIPARAVLSRQVKVRVFSRLAYQLVTEHCARHTVLFGIIGLLIAESEYTETEHADHYPARR